MSIFDENQAENFTLTNTNSKSTNKITKFKVFNFDKRQSTKYNMPLCHYNGYNLWLLKPTHLN